MNFFYRSLSLKSRRGTTEDRDKQCKTLQDLHFEVKIFNYLTYDGLSKQLLGFKSNLICYI